MRKLSQKQALALADGRFGPLVPPRDADALAGVAHHVIALANAEDLNQGWGTALVRTLVRRLFADPAVTRIPDAHFFWEARYNGTKTVAITPDYAVSPQIEPGDLQSAFIKDKDPGFSEEIRSIRTGVLPRAHGSALLWLGCDVAQGYGIARPMPPEAVPEWVRGWQSPAAWLNPTLD